MVVDGSDIVRFSKAFVGFVENPGTTYDLQEIFNREGFFSIYITPLGANLCLLEDRVDGTISTLLAEDGDWIKRWFKVIRPWSPSDVDDCRISWVKCFGIPCHAWLPHVFSSILAPVGEFLCADDSIRNKVKMDVARLLVKTQKTKTVDEDLEIVINNTTFPVKILEDFHTPLRLVPPEIDDSGSSSESKFEADGNFWCDDEKKVPEQQEVLEEGEVDVHRVGKAYVLEVEAAKQGLTFSHKGDFVSRSEESRHLKDVGVDVLSARDSLKQKVAAKDKPTGNGPLVVGPISFSQQTHVSPTQLDRGLQGGLLGSSSKSGTGLNSVHDGSSISPGIEAQPRCNSKPFSYLLESMGAPTPVEAPLKHGVHNVVQSLLLCSFSSQFF